MRKYFMFDDESITGSTYFLRILLGYPLLILFVIPGLWFWAATAYKRSGAFRWSKENRTFSAILVPFIMLINAVVKDIDLPGAISFLLLLITILHLVLLFKDGNKAPSPNKDLVDAIKTDRE